MWSVTVCDAHNHLHDVRLEPFRDGILTECAWPAIVNGTRESDWDAVAALCQAHPALRPAFGLHPWHVAQRTAQWEQTLAGCLDRHPRASIGEAGLDCWIGGHDIEDQKGVFIRQWEMARERDIAITVHCLKAHEPLRQVLQKHRGPRRGFLLHAYAGPSALTGFFMECGAHFSFPPYFLHERKGPQRALFRSLPADRVLVETDAPDLVPPAEHTRRPLVHPETGEPLNHPANLTAAYSALAELRGESLATLTATVEENWHRLFD